MKDQWANWNRNLTVMSNFFDRQIWQKKIARLLTSGLKKKIYFFSQIRSWICGQTFSSSRIIFPATWDQFHVKEMSNSSRGLSKIAFFRALAPIDARGSLEREAGAKNSDFRGIMGINRLSMERGIEWAAQMYSTSISPVENGSNMASRPGLGFEAGIWLWGWNLALRLEFEFPGLHLNLKAEISALRLGFQP